MMRIHTMRIFAAVSAWVHVNIDDGQTRQGVKQRVPDFLGNMMTIPRRQILIDCDMHLSFEIVA
jgi:hypothetical protein